MPTNHHSALKGARVLILGCGYVGRAVAHACLQQQATLAAVTRNPAKAEALLAAGLHQVLVADITDPTLAKQLTGPFDYLLNCVSSGGGSLEQYRRSYVGSQLNLQKMAASWHLKACTYTSSTSVYPDSQGAWLSEADASSEHSERAAILLEAEQQALQVPAARRLVLRLGGIYGPERHYMLDALKQAGQQPLYGSGSTWLNSIHLHDIVTAVLASWLHPQDKQQAIYNVTDDAPAQRQTIAQWLAEKYGLPQPHFDPQLPTPRMARRGITAKDTQAPNRRISNAAIKHALAWQPQYPSFREGYHTLPEPP